MCEQALHLSYYYTYLHTHTYIYTWWSYDLNYTSDIVILKVRASKSFPPTTKTIITTITAHQQTDATSSVPAHSVAAYSSRSELDGAGS